eukprot:12894620-Prorocentrum_lima.AAC.1
MVSFSQSLSELLDLGSLRPVPLQGHGAVVVPRLLCHQTYVAIDGSVLLHWLVCNHSKVHEEQSNESGTPTSGTAAIRVSA